METMTIREFAEEQHVSYEAIRKQVTVYYEDLREHIFKKGRVQYLDEFALEYLRKRRKENPVIVEVQDNREELEQLRADNEKLNNQLLILQQQLIEAEKEKRSLLENKIRAEYLLEAHNKDQEEIREIRERLRSSDQELSEAKTKLQKADTQIIEICKDREIDQFKIETLQQKYEDARSEADSYTRSFFGFYRKK